jgi:PPM family protein phosphatase
MDDDDVDRRRDLSPLLRVNASRPLSETVRVECAGLSRAGRVPARNEDHFLIQVFARTQATLGTSLPAADLPRRFEERLYAFLVADGLGGQGTGALASRVALSTLAHLALHFGRWNVRVDDQTAAEILGRLQWFLERTNEVVRQKGFDRETTQGMSTSLTAAYTAGDDLFVAHVGHSRAYLFRQGALISLTRDQTVARRLEEVSGPTDFVPGSEDLQHILTESIGARLDPPAIEVARHQLKNGDCLLLATNGLTDMVAEDEIAETLALRRNPDDQCARLVGMALDRGGEDNVTVVLGEYTIPGDGKEGSGS